MIFAFRFKFHICTFSKCIGIMQKVSKYKLYPKIIPIAKVSGEMAFQALEPGWNLLLKLCNSNVLIHFYAFDFRI